MALLTSFLVSVFALEASAASSPDQLRSHIRQALFADGPLPALEAKHHSSFEPVEGVVAERISYGTQYQMRVPAILYRPKKAKAKAPALIIVNGHGGDKYSWYPMYAGMLYARAGAFVLTYDPTGEGERNSERKSGTRAHDKVEPFPELGQRMGGLMVTDLRQAVSYLSQRKEVDASRIAATGYSMGSFVLSIACAVEPRLRACILVGGGNLDGPAGYWDNSKPMCQGYPYQSLQFLGDRPVVLYGLHRKTLIYNGLEDTTVAIPKFQESGFQDLRERSLKQLGRVNFETMFHPGTGHRPYFVTRPVALWMEQQLDLPNWTAAQIEQMPVTHVSEWAQKHGVEMDKLYATEHREGGTPALGTGIPGIARDQLHVYPEAEWTAMRVRLIHEEWRAKAKADCTKCVASGGPSSTPAR